MPCVRSGPRTLLAALLLLSGGPLAARGPAPVQAPVPVRIRSSAQITPAGLLRHVKWLADDAREGRLSGSEGEHAAAQYVAKTFQEIGLEPAGEQGGWFQPVPLPGPVEVSRDCSFVLMGSTEGPFILDRDFRPFSISASATVEAEAVFAGYGIRAPELAGYDDYAGLDVSGRIVVVFRHAPAGNHLPAAWGRPAVVRRHAAFVRKLQVAQELGALGLVVVNDPAGTTRGDDLVRTDIGRGWASIPFLHLTLAAGRRLLPQLFGATPAALERSLTGAGGVPRPASRAGRARLRLQVALSRKMLQGRNVCALLRAGAAERTDEIVVLGAHHDHLGRGAIGSLARSAGERSRIHNGADDNASGVAGVLEIARFLAARRGNLRRSVLFMTFTGEERGLLGSRYFVNHPTLPLDRIAAMINLDMIGRLQGRRLFIGGVKTSPAFEPLLRRLAKRPGIKGLGTVFGDGGRAPSDNTSFYDQHLPVLFFFSGMHADYHRPGDDWQKIDTRGMARIARLAAATVEALCTREARPVFQRADGGGIGPPHPVLGIQVAGPAAGGAGPGVAVAAVMEKSPAAKAGMLPGDRIVSIGGRPTPDRAALAREMRRHRIGEEVAVGILRAGKSLALPVALGKG